MEAIVYRKYGSPDVLTCEELDKPVPARNEVLIKVHAASVNPLDWRLMHGVPLPVRMFMMPIASRPKRPGVDVAGEIEALGDGATKFKVGDAVFGTCNGAFAEYVCTTETSLALKPGNISFEQAAAVPIAAFTALQGLRDHGQLQPGQKVLIHGAAGGVGTFAVQIAHLLGADVTAVTSGDNLDLVRRLGADWMIDYTREDFTLSADRYDLIFDCYPNHSLAACRRVLTPTGIYVMAGAAGSGAQILSRMLEARLQSRSAGQRLMFFMARRNNKDLETLHDLIESGKIVPVIDRCYRLREVPDAMRYSEQGHAHGKVAIVVS